MESKIENRKKRELIFFGIGGLILIAGLLILLSTQKHPCPTDLNLDSNTDSIDLQLLVKVYNKRVTENSKELIKYDFNQDSIINAADLSILVSKYGQKCN